MIMFESWKNVVLRFHGKSPVTWNEMENLVSLGMKWIWIFTGKKNVLDWIDGTWCVCVVCLNESLLSSFDLLLTSVVTTNRLFFIVRRWRIHSKNTISVIVDKLPRCKFISITILTTCINYVFFVISTKCTTEKIRKVIWIAWRKGSVGRSR